MLDLKIKAAGRTLAPADLPGAIGAALAYRELGDLVESLIGQMVALAPFVAEDTALATDGRALADGDYAHRSLARFLDRRAAA
ncbi:hypothetical protein [Sphingobium sp. KCTC 72723]|uniref:hypothetical protein n=1 Tax=Sphingobium sp. KCTC 72723 TaxID=2733867 RepID=UPI00165DD58D|nr:hypothetical protein [Sphingobium sp. KCTC 72723]